MEYVTGFRIFARWTADRYSSEGNILFVCDTGYKSVRIISSPPPLRLNLTSLQNIFAAIPVHTDITNHNF